MKNTSPLDKSSSPYYVDNRFCVGDKCIYSGILLNDISLLASKVWSISIMDSLDNVIVVDNATPGLDISGMARNDAVDAIKAAIESAVGEDEYCIINLHTDIVCVAGEQGIGHIDEPEGRGAIFFSDRVSATFDDDETGAFSWIFSDGNEKRVYHLCKAISFVFGTCREHFELQDENRNSNITSANFFVPGEGEEPARWETGTKPIILDNCVMCDYCINFCPRKAIHNRLVGSHNSLSQINYGDPLEASRKTLKEQVARNAKAMTGDDAYSGKFGSGGGDVDGGNWDE